VLPHQQMHGYVEIATEDPGFATLSSGEPQDVPKKSHGFLRTVVESNVFQMCIGTVIAANAVVIGMETDHPDFWIWPILEDLLLATFIGELVARLWAYGFDEFFNTHCSEFHWNVFDFAVVATGATERALALVSLTESAASHAGKPVFIAMVMRTFRLLRILRIFRMFHLLKQLHLLATGLFDALSSMFWMMVLCGLLVYVCAIVLTRLVGRADESDPLAPFKKQYFGSMSATMLTLFQLMAYPDMEKFKVIYNSSPVLQCFFVLLITFGAFTIVSILTGVVSESMVERGKARQDERQTDREHRLSSFVKQVRKVLQEHDDNGKGFLARNHFIACKEDILKICHDQCMDIRSRDLDALFDLVDYEDCGTIEIEEVLYGMVQLSSDVRPMTIMELRRIVVRGLHRVNQHVASLDVRMQQMDQCLHEVHSAVCPKGSSHTPDATVSPVREAVLPIPTLDPPPIGLQWSPPAASGASCFER